MAAALKVGRVLETALYVEDVARAEKFYGGTLGLTPMFRDARLCAMDCGPASVLLLFARDAMGETVRSPFGEIPPHEGQGRLHFAFAVESADLPDWERRLADEGVAIEGRMDWPRGGVSLYFRDPDENLVEIATPGLWANYDIGARPV